jgi:hypothetical protein
VRLVGLMRHPTATPASRCLAAGRLLDASKAEEPSMGRFLDDWAGLALDFGWRPPDIFGPGGLARVVLRRRTGAGARPGQCHHRVRPDFRAETGPITAHIGPHLRPLIEPLHPQISGA